MEQITLEELADLESMAKSVPHRIMGESQRKIINAFPRLAATIRALIAERDTVILSASAKQLSLDEIYRAYTDLVAEIDKREDYERARSEPIDTLKKQLAERDDLAATVKQMREALLAAERFGCGPVEAALRIPVHPAEKAAK